MTAEVNAGLATLSDQLTLATVLLYVFAMIGYALDLGFGRSKVRAGAQAGRVLVTVGGGTDAAPPGSEEGQSPSEKATPAWTRWAGPVAVGLTWVGWAAHLTSILTRGLSVGRWPWGNMYEFVVAMCFAAVSAFLFMTVRYGTRFLGAFVTVAAALGLGFAVRYLHVQAGPVVPALNSYWVAIHVTAAIIASGLFIMAGVSGILYLVRKDTAVRLPSRADLERVAHRAIVIGFPIWTFAVIAGALWADKAWGRYWGWDPKEIWAFITWIAYAGYLHARATAGFKGRAAMIVQLIAFGCLLFNLVGVNILLGGLHSYAEVP
ncbi:cytochrome c-type biogenesis protein CcsB [Streptosporangium album]|uniref:Cytochrome c-type biogenesis protein CcsB n=1 Tax=Streptosporangium album TaxID=47479 RepID=A0A7W7RVG0_9ACTN|nr:c-type cytochrome biogenesis protein CcsB [Streptosporangium album]MBB4938988.1 cytochrome c-type biogenesis protein CcsB [Streptosporangium album]